MASFMGYEDVQPLYGWGLEDLLLLDSADQGESLSGDDLAILYRDTEDGGRDYFEFINGELRPIREDLLADGRYYSLREENDYVLWNGRLQQSRGLGV